MVANLVASILLVAGPPLFPPLAPAQRPRAQLVRALDELAHTQLRDRARALSGVKTRADLEHRREEVAAKSATCWARYRPSARPWQPGWSAGWSGPGSRSRR